jgi:hypothetical protein
MVSHNTSRNFTRTIPANVEGQKISKVVEKNLFLISKMTVSGIEGSENRQKITTRRTENMMSTSGSK